MGAGRLLSFRNGKCVEHLDEHVSLMLRCYEEIYATSGWNAVTAKRLGIDEETADAANRVAIVYHDLGKAFFQDRIARGRGSPYHELYSVLLLQETKHALLRRFEGLERVYPAIAWSIVVHHLSLREDAARRALARPSAAVERSEAELSESAARSISRMIRSWLGVNAPVRSGRYALDDLRRSGLAGKLINDLKSFYPLALRITRVLLTTDALAAREKRCDRGYRVYVADLPGRGSLEGARERLRGWLQSS